VNTSRRARSTPEREPPPARERPAPHTPAAHTTTSTQPQSTASLEGVIGGIIGRFISGSPGGAGSADDASDARIPGVGTRRRTHAHRDPTANEAITRVIAALNGAEGDPDPELVGCSGCGLIADLRLPYPDVRFVQRGEGWYHGHRPLPARPDWLAADPDELAEKRDDLVKQLKAYTRSTGLLEWLDGRWQYSEPIAWVNLAIGSTAATGYHRLGLPRPCWGRWRPVTIAQPTKRVLEHLAGYAHRNAYMTLGEVA
jgi:hypothetical protein